MVIRPLPVLPFMKYLTGLMLYLVVKGNSHNLCKAGAKRRRTREEIKEEKETGEFRAREIAQKMEMFDQMQA